MSRREFQHLAEAGDLIPPGRGTKSFKRSAVIGAAMGAGVPLFSAASLAKVIVKAEFNQEDGEAPSGLNFLARNLSREAIDQFLPSQAQDTNDYHYHYALIRGPDYRRGKALGSDALVEIIDRRIIMTSSVQFPKWQIAGWIENWGRASEAEIVLASEKVSMKSWQRDFAALQDDADRSRENAVAKITINLSLAIRNAFDRLNDYREKSTLAGLNRSDE